MAFYHGGLDPLIRFSLTGCIVLYPNWVSLLLDVAWYRIVALAVEKGLGCRGGCSFLMCLQ